MGFKVSNSIEIPTAELHFSYSRSGGPGGQHVNKTSTKVTLKWNPQSSLALTERQSAQIVRKTENKTNSEGDIVIQSDRFRDRGRNTADCLDKLRELITQALKRQKKRVATKVPKSQKKKRRENKQMRSEVKKSRKKIDY